MNVCSNGTSPRESYDEEGARFLIAGVVLLVLIGWFYYTPYMAFDSLKKAAARGDAQAVAEHVDFPSLRESIKSWIKVPMMKRMVKAMKDNPFAGLGLMIANAVVDPMVDAMISPAGLAAMMEGKSPSPQENGVAAERQDDSKSGSGKDIEVSKGYAGFDQFEYSAKERGGKFEVTLVFHRYGFRWKLAEVRLPPLDE